MITPSLLAFTRTLKRFTPFLSGDERPTSQDKVLATRLYSTFERDLELADVVGIQFFVQDGIVTLFGTIRNELDKDLLVSFVRRIPGVKGVVAELQVVDARFRDDQPRLPEAPAA